ncbi:MAG TPA: (2Fe-2S) ferredoxin domain-containing protein [Armatimonadota bacterium]|jgi:NADH:ubiquinone oxidoreductase subunit E
MRVIHVCVGSSCFLKGSYRILDTFTSLARQFDLEQEVSIVGAFCMERCQHGVSVTIDDTVYSVPDPTAARVLFGNLFLGESESTS